MINQIKNLKNKELDVEYSNIEGFYFFSTSNNINSKKRI